MATMSKKTSKNKTEIKSSWAVGRTAFLIAILFLVVYLVSILTDSNIFFTQSAERSAIVNIDEEIKRTEALAEVHYRHLYEIVDRLQYSETAEDVADIMNDYIGADEFGNLRYYSKGQTFTADGTALDTETGGDELIKALVSQKVQGCTDVYFDPFYTYDCVAFFVPVRGSQYVDGILSIMPARNLIHLDGVAGDKTSAVILVDKTGKVLSAKGGDGFDYVVGSDLYEFMGDFASSKEYLKTISDTLALNKLAACSIDTASGDYTLAFSPISTFDNRFVLITVSESAGLIDTEMVYIRHVVTLMFIAIVSLVLAMVYAVFYYRRMRVAIDDAGALDPIVGCPNLATFRKTASEILQEHKRKYAVYVMDTRQYTYLTEHMEPAMMTDLLKYIARVIETFCAPRETYGYAGDGKFLILVQYDGEKSIRDRVRLVEAMAGKHAILGRSKTKKKFNVGVCVAGTTRNNTVQELIDFATIACDKAKNNINIAYEIYSEAVSVERTKNDRIEADMENALEDGEFRLFLQPKYNVAKDEIDSAEALVRWFDPKKGDYRFPGEFLGLFETNGFITKLDHFMYEEALKTLANAIEREEKVIPISVNVSFITVNQEGFADFYIACKKKYNIPDELITVEFTESFATDEFSKVRDIVRKFRENGIRCSLDGFGAGYASLAVLKNVPFDEVKIDRIFIQPGFNQKYDSAMLRTLFDLAKSLGMNVVQEGVETKEMFESAVANGCDTVQGYYYAKAVAVEEYKLFINSNTSIKYKALVK